MDKTNRPDLNRWISLGLLVVILIAGAALRFVGLDWDAEQHLHPDERFLTMVESSLLPVESVGDYFNTSQSTLNPNNRGHGFFVYGTLPIFMVRYVAEWLDSTGYGSVYLVGRSLSAVMDLLSVVLVFFIGTRLFNRKVGLLGAAFSSMAVLQIQQAHFFTVDTFSTFFTLLAFYFAVEVVTAPKNKPDLVSYLLFGLALGMAVASKVNAVPVAATLPLAALIHWLRMDPEEKNQHLPRIILYLALAALTSLVAFRIFQPYAFAGPSFFNFQLNQNWVGSLKALQAQASGDVDFPPALQWARRPIWFSLKNMVLWGLGLPLGILAWIGFLWMGGKQFSRQPWKPMLVLWAWTAVYFSWQSLQWNSTMRYQLPIYPLLALFAGWLLIHGGDSLAGKSIRVGKVHLRPKLLQVGAIGIGTLALLLTGLWGFSFSRIYTTPHPRVAATRWIFANIPGPATLEVQTPDGGEGLELLSYPEDFLISQETAWLTNFTARYSGQVESVYFPAVVPGSEKVDSVHLQAAVNDLSGVSLTSGQARITFQQSSAAGRIAFDSPLDLVAGETYQFSLKLLEAEKEISLGRIGIANESSWDDGLPLRMDGYDPFGGIYQGGLNLELYWDDNQEKLERFLTTLDEAEYLLITSSRQWATTTRVPERYPLTTEYYQQLMGCPDEITVEECYNKAQPGTYQGALGFELIETFQSNPSLGPWEINDQPAEEAFTVYDHPKVFIFQKSASYQPQTVAKILSGVDLTTVLHITPKEADRHPADLMLPPDRLAEQRRGGTWRELFNPDALQNRSQLVAAIVWYVSIFVLGLLVYPLMRPLLSGLDTAGYPLARTFGALLLSYLAWLAGSAGIPVQRSTIFGLVVLMAGAGLYLGYRQRDELIQIWNSSRRYFLMVEILALSLFLISLLIRFGNPDLWHPWKGGERPMDFSYFNAVLKSTTFPPYDPWFAGGYINYYYYGFVFVGMVPKLLGIMPSLAYNLILPTLFMMLGLGAFTIVWNIFKGDSAQHRLQDLPYLGGIAGVAGMVLLGNLGVMRLVFQGLQRLASGGVNVVDGNLFQRTKWTFVGLARFAQKPTLHYRLDEWYWNPSRVIGAEHGGPITEFPFFTFLYGDLHAHLIALPLTVLALAWMVSIVKDTVTGSRDRSSWLQRLGIPLFGALAVGSLRPTNTWDFYPYLALGGAALLYVWWRESRKENYSWKAHALRLGLFLLLAFLTFQPYASWYGEGYTSIKPWFGTHTPINDYLIHWGLFLFIIISWMVVETVAWMAATPVSELRKLEKIRELIIASLLVLVVILVSLGTNLENPVKIGQFSIMGAGVQIIWIVLPLMAWSLVLLLRPERDLMKGLVLFLIGTALGITLMVEIVYVEGDIGRMNTVFKFYLQAWILLSVSSAAALGWLLRSFRKPDTPLRILWQAVFYILLTSAALYPLLGGVAKIKDRMAPEAPNSLDGMAFMQYATYFDLDTALDLSQDYQAIRWMQDNVPGSPVIVEANQVEYHWGTRYTVYTGLPGVVGWNWHQRQQRTITPHDWIFSRVEAVNSFYDTTDLNQAKEFLAKYQVNYIIVGQLERVKYLPDGIAKFEQAEGDLWQVVYHQGDTIIYQTLPAVYD